MRERYHLRAFQPGGTLELRLKEQQDERSLAPLDWAASLPKLISLRVEADFPVTLHGIETLTKLNSLHVEAPLADISSLKEATSLKDLHLEYRSNPRLPKQTWQDDFLGVKDNLQSLTIRNIRVNRISGLQSFTRLETLDVANSRVRDLEGITKLGALRTFRAKGAPLLPRQCPQQVTLCELTSLAEEVIPPELPTPSTPGIENRPTTPENPSPATHEIFLPFLAKTFSEH